MIPEKISIQEIFSRERQFTVPLFQRSYVWNRETQWEPLWEDILSRAEAHLRRAQHETEGRLRSHFLGAIVLNVATIQGRSIASSDVIDGQQRLTTLQLLLAALRDLARALGADEKDARLFSRLTRNPDCEDESEELFKVWPTNSDREVYRAVMTAGSRSAVAELAGGEATLPRMAQAYVFFSEQIESFLQGEDNAASIQDRFFALRSALNESLQLVVIELEEGDDPQIIFETLNARGQPLLPSDLIRNYVFMRMPSGRSEKLYREHWHHFDSERVSEADAEGENRFWHMEIRQGRLTRPRIDLFIFHYLTVKTEEDIRIGQLFKEFRDWRDDNPRTTNEEFLKDLKQHSAWFRRLVAPQGETRLEIFARRLRSLDTSTVYPLLLFLASIEGAGLTTAELDRCVTDLESFLVRRFICDLTPKNYNRFFLSLLTKAKAAQASGQPVHAAIRDELLRGDLDTTLWPNDKRFSEGWQKKVLYVRSRPDRSAMILAALDAAMGTTKNEKHKLVTDNLSVEHLLPQSSPLEYYPHGDVDLDEGYTIEEFRRDLMHTVGNLTLLTTPLNSTISNGPIDAKAAQIAEESDLRINAWMRREPPAKWDENDIRERGHKLFEVAKTVWPRSQSQSIEG
jgi:hypothetical protein